MSDSYVSVTYTYRYNNKSYEDVTPTYIETERTIIVPRMLEKEMVEIDLADRKRHCPDFELLTQPTGKPVSLTYPCPKYWA